MLDRDEFAARLDRAMAALLQATEQHCTNRLVPELRFTQSLGRHDGDMHDGMDASSIALLHARTQRANDLLTKNDLIGLLFVDGRVPRYINAEVWRAEPDRTIVQLLISRRLATDAELYHSVDRDPPFHVLVAIPPEYALPEKAGMKWDVNWRK
jgi:hypothetical protein